MASIQHTPKDRVRELLEQLPDDCTVADILRELAFLRMVDRGVAQADRGELIEDQDVVRMIDSWEESTGRQKPLNG